MKIAAYCRVSTDKEEQLNSLAHQKEFFTAYAERNGHTLVQLYADEGISGTSLKRREEFKRLLQDAELGLFDMVVVKDISRFARNTVDALQSIRKLKSMGINTLFLTANMDSMGDSEFILTLFSAMAQEESNNLSKRVKWGKRINAEKGRVPQRIFGYERINNFTLAINPEEARIVRRIFSLYCDQGLGCRTISMTLNRDQEKTKYGCEWNPRGVRRILVNPMYCGILVNHKYEIEDFLTGKQIHIPKEEHFCHQRPSWAIVSPEVFQKAQEIMESRRRQYDSGKPCRASRYSSRHLFSTLIKCQHCGRSFTRKTYTYANTRVYWKCVTNDRYTAQQCPNRVCLDEGQLKEALKEYFHSQLGDSSTFTGDILRELCQSPQNEEKNLESRKQRLLAKQDRYREMYANDLIGLEDLKEKLRRLQMEAAELESRRCQPVSPPDRNEEIENFLNLETMTNPDLRQLLDHICVSQDGTVRVVLKTLPPA